MTEAEAHVLINMLPGIGAVKFRALRDEFGSAAAIFRQSAKSLSAVKGVGSELAERVVNWEKDIDLGAELDFVKRGGVKIVCECDSSYPASLREIYDPPICLYVRGELPEFNRNTIAIVGSRRISDYGRRMANYLSESAARANWVVVSGLAFGADAAAHAAATACDGLTVAVLGSGLAKIHPQENIPLAREIIEKGGAVISEFPMRFPASRQSFPRRNRIVSALSSAVLVIEAGLESGAIITAEIAVEQGKSVFAVPGEVDNPQAKGCHYLIKQGAKLTENFEDVLEEFSFLPGLDLSSNNETDVQGEENPVSSAALSDEETRIIEILQDGEKSLDAIAIAAPETSKLLMLVSKMEMKKLISRSADGYYSLSR